MNNRPRKGRSVFFEPTVSGRPRSDSIIGLRFTIEARHGGTALVDMTGLSPRALAITFAGALRRMAALGGSIGAASVIKAYVTIYRRFFAWIFREARSVETVADLRAAHIDDFVSVLELGGQSPIHQHIILGKIINTLRVIEADHPDRLAPDLRDRLRFTLPTSVGRSIPRDAYSPHVARALRDASRADVEAMFRRIGASVPGDKSDPNQSAIRTNVEAIITRDGAIAADRVEVRRLYLARLRRGQPSNMLISDLHGRYHLVASDLPALLVLLILETGLEPECLKTLTVDCLANAHAGTVELRYLKRRARGAEYKSMRIRDGGSGTPGGLIRRLIDITAAARQHLADDCLWLYHNNGGLKSCIHRPQERLDTWVKHHQIIDDTGKPLRLLLTRLRKTHKALWYIKSEGHMARFAVGHSSEVAARHYADLPSLRPLHETTVVDAFRAAVAASMPIVLSPTVEQALREAPERAAPMMPADRVGPLLNGSQDVWLASCADFHGGPFAEAGSPCAQPFWGCLDCPNAVITARKLPAILAFVAFIEDQRRSLPANDWAAKFGRAHARITKQVLPAFSDAIIADARTQMTDEQLYMPPETHA